MTSQFIDVEGRRVRVKLAGDSGAPPLVLVHGISSSLEDWAAVIAEFATDYRVIALDVPGFGYSDPAPDSITINALADATVGVLDALGEMRPAQWIGNSLGGAIALAASVRHPDRVSSLVLVSPAAFGRSVTPLLRSLTVPVLGKILASRPNRNSVAMLQKQVFADPALATRYRIDHAMAIAKETDAGEFSRRVAAEVASVRGVKEKWRRQLLAQAAANPVPTTVVWGAKDRILPASHAGAVRAALPHADVVVLPGVGHMAQLEVPERFLAIARPFLAATCVTEAQSAL
ncbi:alpha/beta fold hydrolase [Gordonia sp. (in: high G+C Gram-positive bacteria)]|uniref:alpha/beta fold hydrolase n=1 Tax=Gordonia sp. (in: high G+C Gram-positive bacteria) TaxID=84139 RepID=UPI003C78696A